MNHTRRRSLRIWKPNGSHRTTNWRCQQNSPEYRICYPRRFRLFRWVIYPILPHQPSSTPSASSISVISLTSLTKSRFLDLDFSTWHLLPFCQARHPSTCQEDSKAFQTQKQSKRDVTACYSTSSIRSFDDGNAEMWKCTTTTTTTTNNNPKKNKKCNNYRRYLW